MLWYECLGDADIFGSTHSIYPTVFGAHFHGKTFLESAVEIKLNLGVLPIAMPVRNQQSKATEIVINPTSHIVSEGELVYVISRDRAEACKVGHKTPLR